MHIVDADAHISPYSTYGRRNSIEDLIRQLDYAGVQ